MHDAFSGGLHLLSHKPALRAMFRRPGPGWRPGRSFFAVRCLPGRRRRRRKPTQKTHTNCVDEVCTLVVLMCVIPHSRFEAPLLHDKGICPCVFAKEHSSENHLRSKPLSAKHLRGRNDIRRLQRRRITTRTESRGNGTPEHSPTRSDRTPVRPLAARSRSSQARW
jgi:hypothetical protein